MSKYDIKLDDKGDLELRRREDGLYDIVMIAGVDRIVQNVKVLLGTLKGEYNFDETVGLPLLEYDGKNNKLSTYILSSKISRETQVNILSQLITSVDGVASILNITITPDSKERTAVINIALMTDEGETVEFTYTQKS